MKGGGVRLTLAMGVGLLLAEETGGVWTFAPLTALVFPSRIDQCGEAKSQWSQLKLAALVFDEEARANGISSVLDDQRWALINGRPLTADAELWPTGNCQAFDVFVEDRVRILEDLAAGEGDTDSVGTVLENSIKFIDAEKLGIVFEDVARRYAGAAFIAPHTILIPPCIQAPVPRRQEENVDFSLLYGKFWAVLHANDKCVGCLRELILDVGEMVTGAPVNPDVADEALKVIGEVKTKIETKLNEYVIEGNSTLPLKFIKDMLPPIAEIAKKYALDDKKPQIAKFLRTVRDELRACGDGPIESRFQEFFEEIGC